MDGESVRFEMEEILDSYVQIIYNISYHMWSVAAAESPEPHLGQMYVYLFNTV